MKKMKRIAAFLTAATIAITPCVLTSFTAFAEDDEEPVAAAVTNSITIVPQHDDETHNNHAYAAYQIFSGTISGGAAEDDPDTDVDETKYVLSYIEWGDNVNGTTFLAALKASTDPAFMSGTPSTNIFAECETAEDVANILEGANDNSDLAIAFAKFAGEHLTGAAKGSDSEPDTAGKYVIPTDDDDEAPALEPGYYLVKDGAALNNNPNDTTSRTLNMLQVVGAVTMETKDDLPHLDKAIDEEGGIDANTASIGDDVPFILTSEVPNMIGYDRYFYYITDVLSAGLTFNNDVAITIGGTPLTEDEDYTCTEEDGTIEIVFLDFLGNWKEAAGQDIVITYSAEVDEDADMTQTGNTNTVHLNYSNNPNVAQEPDTDHDNPNKPDENFPIGQTPDDITVTYVTQIDMTKTEGDGETPLEGATFKLEGYMKDVSVVNGEYYVKTDGTEAAETPLYYRLADGSYVLVSSIEAGTTVNHYESTGATYKKVALADVPATSLYTSTKITPSTGILNFAGLGEGVYTLTEISAPDGFGVLPQPITITITADESLEGCEWECTIDDPNNAVADADDVTFNQGDATHDSVLALTVINKPANTLPSTGGIGTKLFYIFGGMLVVGSGVVLVTKKRMSGSEK